MAIYKDIFISHSDLNLLTGHFFIFISQNSIAQYFLDFRKTQPNKKIHKI